MNQNSLIKIGLTAWLFAASGSVLAQGQDSQPHERDLQVIATLLQGGFDNANQSYFDFRGKSETRHRRIHLQIEKRELRGIGNDVFEVSGYWDNDASELIPAMIWSLTADDASNSVRMRSWMSVDADSPQGAVEDSTKHCDVLWRREAAQFRATAESGCEAIFVQQLVLSDKQLWMAFEEAGTDYQMHRIRPFECYADVPGVGGGRDEPYERYEGFKIHDQGGEAWFTSNEGRRLGISLFLVDWPINNYDGVFTRDSFVVYVSEEMDDGTRKEHGYGFTIPEADRIGINLKWILASCFMTSNQHATPFM